MVRQIATAHDVGRDAVSALSAFLLRLSICRTEKPSSAESCRQ
jgi:hypothetical protein